MAPSNALYESVVAFPIVALHFDVVKRVARLKGGGGGTEEWIEQSTFTPYSLPYYIIALTLTLRLVPTTGFSTPSRLDPPWLSDLTYEATFYLEFKEGMNRRKRERRARTHQQYFEGKESSPTAANNTGTSNTLYATYKVLFTQPTFTLLEIFLLLLVSLTRGAEPLWTSTLRKGA